MNFYHQRFSLFLSSIKYCRFTVQLSCAKCFAIQILLFKIWPIRLRASCSTLNIYGVHFFQLLFFTLVSSNYSFIILIWFSLSLRYKQRWNITKFFEANSWLRLLRYCSCAKWLKFVNASGLVKGCSEYSIDVRKIRPTW